MLFCAACAHAPALLRRVDARRIGLAQLAIAGAVSVGSLAVAQDESPFAKIQWTPQLELAQDFLDTQYPRCRVALVTPLAPYFLTHGRSAFPVQRLDAARPVLAAQIASGALDEVVFVRMTHPASGAELPDYALPDALRGPVLLARPVNGVAGLALVRLSDEALAQPAAGHGRCP
jgi:hypothetical protein